MVDVRPDSDRVPLESGSRVNPAEPDDVPSLDQPYVIGANVQSGTKSFSRAGLASVQDRIPRLLTGLTRRAVFQVGPP
jgi:hypothetical protein